MELWTEQIIQAHAGDKDARNRLVAENLGLVHAVTRRFEHRGHDREELFQIGCIGLMKAIDKFDVSHLRGTDDYRGDQAFSAG